MPLYGDSPSTSAGVQPVKDQNFPTPPHQTSDQLQKPDFIREAELELIAVRKELSELWAEMYGIKYGARSQDIPWHPYGDPKRMTVSGIERDMEYSMRQRKLEEREAELAHVINSYKYVASLGDAPAEEDVPGEDERGTSGALAGVGSR
jgi:hypothetical protein